MNLRVYQISIRHPLCAPSEKHKSHCPLLGAQFTVGLREIPTEPDSGLRGASASLPGTAREAVVAGEIMSI